MQSLTPDNKNYAQAMLYHAGEKVLGATEAHRSFDTDVRRTGVKHLGKRVLAAGVTVGLIGAGAEFVGSAMDRSPTFVKYREEHPENVTHVEVRELPENPADLKVHVKTGEQAPIEQ